MDTRNGEHAILPPESSLSILALASNVSAVISSPALNRNGFQCVSGWRQKRGGINLMAWTETLQIWQTQRFPRIMSEDSNLSGNTQSQWEYPISMGIPDLSYADRKQVLNNGVTVSLLSAMTINITLDLEEPIPGLRFLTNRRGAELVKAS
ncbi:hypothetical protein PoB_002885700 [Plakobranchus ocellatus]|uniref:Uncharacterized protein n=1 Tax=Plakobranchus ocellatus TaxID=259542 RepID=A0AAV4A683_9GAST|nr:hypothetical protein PoB_002885700 [Plakobranchus ocellatus]